MTWNVTGVVDHVGDIQEFGNFKKREVWLEVKDGDYTNHIAVEYQGKNIGKTPVEGETVNVELALRGRKWNPPDKDPRVFNTLVALRTEVSY